MANGRLKAVPRIKDYARATDAPARKLEAENQDLKAQLAAIDRAQAVITYLSRLGVDPARLRKVPKGSGEATGVEESGFAKDRRVDFTWE